MKHNPMDALLDSAADALLDNCVWLTKNLGKKIQSKIEIILFLAIYTFHHIHFGSAACENPPAGSTVWRIQPQHQIDKYRVDFLISRGDLPVSLVVECDGHEYHERTKEQAEHDRSRDRYLTAKGYRVVRFTGREIWRDPWKCAEEINAQFTSIVEKWNEAHG